MAGSNPAFDPAVFRAAIHAAMAMAQATTVSQQVKFVFPEVAGYNGRSSPYNWTATPTTDVAEVDVTVPCAVQWALPASDEGTPVGIFDVDRVIVTLLDVDYATVAGATEMVINERHYRIVSEAPPIGLFEVTVHQVHGEALG